MVKQVANHNPRIIHVKMGNTKPDVQRQAYPSGVDGADVMMGDQARVDRACDRTGVRGRRCSSRPFCARYCGPCERGWTAGGTPLRAARPARACLACHLCDGDPCARGLCRAACKPREACPRSMSLRLRSAVEEYLAQIAGGIPMSQGELVRPRDLGLGLDGGPAGRVGRLAALAVSGLMQRRARLVALMAESARCRDRQPRSRRDACVRSARRCAVSPNARLRRTRRLGTGTTS